ncbi:methyltransferase domain-containing protein [Salinarimonas chemoclinalis]|uniref:methyltransferase domain-containing protein n=1 Tax=Salinarimonas chemoclinalis TaxID=3241599 RepID=UPI003558F2CE
MNDVDTRTLAASRAHGLVPAAPPIQPIPRWHFAMMNDHRRTHALRVAFAAAGLAGRRVLEIGTGAGLMATLLVEAGAREVWTCEADPALAAFARDAIRRLGLADRVHVVCGMSSDLALEDLGGERFDVVAGEIVDCGFFGEGILPSFADARERFLAPGGRLLPARVRLVGALLESPHVHALNHIGPTLPEAFRAFDMFSTRGHFPLRANAHPHAFLCDPKELLAVDLERAPPRSLRAEATATPSRAGLAHGVLFWFDAPFGGEVGISNDPRTTPTHWHQAVCLFPTPLPVRAGVPVPLSIRVAGTRVTILPEAPGADAGCALDAACDIDATSDDRRPS